MAPKNSKMKGSSSNVAVPLHQKPQKPQKPSQVVDPEKKREEKNLYNKQRRAAIKREFQRLQKVETQSKQTQDENTELKRENNQLKRENSQLKRENNQLKSMLQNSENQEARTNQLSSGWQLTKIEGSEDFGTWSPKWTPPCAEFRQMEENVKSLGNATDSLANDNELLKSRVPLLENEMAELRSNLHQKESHVWRTSFDEAFPGFELSVAAHAILSEKDAANNVLSTQGPRSSQGGRMYTEELVHDFTKKLDAKDKSQVDFSNCRGLMKELPEGGMVTLPPSLDLIDKQIKEKYGDIAAESKQSRCTAMRSRILLCAAIKEMQELQLESIDEEKMLLWRDAINSALNIDFKVDFAIQHLKKIARAYFGLEARNDQDLSSINDRISTLQFELSDLKIKRYKKVEEQISEVAKECRLAAEYFQGKSLSAGLLH